MVPRWSRARTTSFCLPRCVELPRPGTASEHPDGLDLLCRERLGLKRGLDGQRREHANLNRADHAFVARFTAPRLSQTTVYDIC